MTDDFCGFTRAQKAIHSDDHAALRETALESRYSGGPGSLIDETYEEDYGDNRYNDEI